MGEADKGLVLLDGRPLVSRVLERIAPQVDELLVSANRSLELYRALGFPVLCDEFPGFSGPLAGLHRAMQAAAHPLVLSVPCDTPFLPGDLAARLRAALEQAEADVAVPLAEGRAQPAVCLCRRDLAAGLADFLAAGGRRVGEWQHRLKRVEVSFGQAGDFLNINTPEQLDAAVQSGALRR